jgi:1-acyl-sn-glycerol-3-phosphate acyltransferase
MSGVWRHPLRFVLRFAEFLAFLVRASVHFLWTVQRRGRAGSRRGRAEWLQRWARNGLAIFRCHVEVKGTLPAGGIVASNHLSYVDILVLGSLQPCVFVSKADVRRWPVFGWLAQAGGTLFIRREKRSDVAEVSRQLAPVLAESLPLVMFLEGTSTGGDHVLPFRPSLLEPVVAGGWAAVPVWIGYSLEDGSVRDEVAYWRDMTLLPHLMNLLTKRRLTAHVAFGEPITATDRKELARRLQQRVCELAAQFGRTVSVGSDWHALPVAAGERGPRQP